jgi:hypothetical protein
VAAVVADQPQFAGYRLVVPSVAASASPRGSLIGPPSLAERRVLAERVDGGFRLIFVTGSGDCASGCTIHRYDVFVVCTGGSVEKACVVGRLPVGRGDPCAGG